MSVTGASVVTCGQCGNAMWVPKPEPPVPASSPVTVIREAMEDFRRRSAECKAIGNAVGEVFLDGRISGLEFALRALGVEP